ncbi:MAG: hypothetical protein IKT41_03985 [Clostridia bacterium]|nr:hypothetical protein [Clostridia bacterium]
MKYIGFIGGYDKTDFILYISKILSLCEKKILVVDTTKMQKSKYIVPNINSEETYITQFENIDIAVGTYSKENLEQLLAVTNENISKYDYIFIDIDSKEILQTFMSGEEEIKNYFVTSFDLYSLRKGMEALQDLENQINITKVLFTTKFMGAEDEYLNFVLSDINIKWEEEKIYMPFYTDDQEVIYENQITSKIKLKKLSNQYKEGLVAITSTIDENININEIKKAIKTLERV